MIETFVPAVTVVLFTEDLFVSAVTVPEPVAVAWKDLVATLPDESLIRTLISNVAADVGASVALAFVPHSVPILFHFVLPALLKR